MFQVSLLLIVKIIVGLLIQYQCSLHKETTQLASLQMIGISGGKERTHWLKMG